MNRFFSFGCFGSLPPDIIRSCSSASPFGLISRLYVQRHKAKTDTHRRIETDPPRLLPNLQSEGKILLLLL